jgi:hypothetical protein
MGNVEHKLVPFENLGGEKNDLLLEYPSSCFVGVVHYITEGRNAWHNHWSKKYMDESAFTITLDEAEANVERWRIQGSTFTIRHLPCAVFASARYSLCLAEINTPNPLLRYGLGKLGSLGVPLHQLCMMFQPLTRNSTIRLVTLRKDVARYSEPQLMWRSRSRGGGFPLRWVRLNTNPGQQDITQITRFVDACDVRIKRSHSAQAVESASRSG